MAVPVVNDGETTTRTGIFASSASWPHTTSGSNRALLVIVSNWKSGGGEVPDSVTFDSQAMSMVANIYDSTDGNRLTFWILALEGVVTTGSKTIAVTMPSSNDIIAHGFTLTGVDQTTPNRTAATVASTGAPTINVTSTADDLVLDGVAYYDAGNISAGSGQTAVATYNGYSSFSALFSSEEAAVGTPTTMSWTTDIGYYAMAALPIIPAPAAAGQPTMRRWQNTPHMPTGRPQVGHTGRF
jgi:hypothetical protein